MLIARTPGYMSDSEGMAGQGASVTQFFGDLSKQQVEPLDSKWFNVCNSKLPDTNKLMSSIVMLSFELQTLDWFRDAT